MPLTPVAVNVILVPTHNGFGEALTLVIVGNGLTVTAGVTDVLLVHPVPGNVTARLYTPLANVVVAVNTGDMAVEL